MKAIETSIQDLFIIEPKVFHDERGFFMESFNHEAFEKIIGRKVTFVQDNHSCSDKNVLRGLHYQLQPYAQGKLVRCVRGAVFDVAVDIRRESLTFGKWFGLILSEENKKQLWIPEGFAHGFITLTENTEFLYKTTDYYAPQYERGIIWNDPNIGIKWNLNSEAILSDKDKKLPFLNDAEVF